MQNPEASPPELTTPAADVASTQPATLPQPVATAAPPDQYRREALRKAGADFLEKALLQAKKTGSQDPFAPVEAPLPSTPAIQRAESRPTPSRHRAKSQALPEDVAAFGQVFESTKLYVYCGIYLACQSAIYVLIKGSLTTMKTPGLMAFLHMGMAVFSFWISTYYDIFDMSQVIANPQQALLGCSVRAALYGIQMLTLYGALLHSSVHCILSWAATAPLLLDAGLALAVGQPSRLLAPQTIPLLVAAAAATVLELLLDRTLGWLAVLLLAAWSCAKLAETGWRLLKEDPSLGGRLPGGDFGPLASLVRRVAEAEAVLEPPPAALLVNLLPALPVLLAGFVGQEGREIVDHELSVPAAQLMLLSCVAHVGLTWGQLLLHDRISGAAKAGLRWGALLGAVAFNMTEKTAGATLGTAACAVAAVGASAVAALQRHGGGGGGGLMMGAGGQLRAFQGLTGVAAGGGGGGGGNAIDDDDDRDPEA